MSQPVIAHITARALREYLRTDAPEELDNNETADLTALAGRLEAAQEWSEAVDSDLCEAFEILSGY